MNEEKKNPSNSRDRKTLEYLNTALQEIFKTVEPMGGFQGGNITLSPVCMDGFINLVLPLSFEEASLHEYIQRLQKPVGSND